MQLKAKANGLSISTLTFGWSKASIWEMAIIHWVTHISLIGAEEETITDWLLEVIIGEPLALQIKKEEQGLMKLAIVLALTIPSIIRVEEIVLVQATEYVIHLRHLKIPGLVAQRLIRAPMMLMDLVHTQRMWLI